MKSVLRLCLLVTLGLVASITTTSAFAPTPTNIMGGINGGSSFVVSTKATQAAIRPLRQQQQQQQRSHHASAGISSLKMGGSQAKFGIFSPAVYAAKIVLGKEKLNKLRGKGISLHSQAIGDFCQWVGAYHLRTKLVKKAKTNGDILGFLV